MIVPNNEEYNKISGDIKCVEKGIVELESDLKSLEMDFVFIKFELFLIFLFMLIKCFF